ncbi:unnamed protein product, partial [Staurois parvus]
STAENQQLLEQGSAPIIRALGAQQYHPQLCPAVRPLTPPSSVPTSSAHLCPAVHPLVPSSALTCATQQCHTSVPRSATYLCPAVPPTSAHQCSPAVLPVSGTSQCPA